MSSANGTLRGTRSSKQERYRIRTFFTSYIKNNYEACEANVFEITQRIEKANTSINDLEEDIKQSQQCRFQTPQPNVGTGSGLADTHDYLDGMTDDELGIFNNYPNGEDEDVHQGVDATVAFNDQDIHDPEEIE